jgi:MFS transporter, DHA2 family, metal-tetracycline-proton antiporter
MKALNEINTRHLVPWVCYLLFFAVLNETMFNVSTPIIAHQFTITASGVSWMMTIFMVLFGIGSVIYGRLSDMVSLKRLVVIGIAIYNTGSILGFTLQHYYPAVLAARAIQGIGCSALPALVFVAVARYFPDSDRGRVFGLLTSTASVSIGLGPVIGGFISTSVHWSFLFLIPMATLIAIPNLVKALPDEERREGKIDILGALLVAASVGSLILFLNFSEWYLLGMFALSLGLTVTRMFTAKDPFIRPSLFRNKRFRASVITAFFLFSVVFGIFFLVPLMLDRVHGLKSNQIGLILFPGAISAVFAGPLAGNLADKRGNIFVVSLGIVSLLASMLILSVFLSVSIFIIAGTLLFTYIGFSFFQIAMVNGVSQTLDHEETGIGMGIFNLAAIISGAVGTALAGKILDSRILDFTLIGNPIQTRGYDFSNLILVFAIVFMLGGSYYLWSYKRRNPFAQVLFFLRGLGAKSEGSIRLARDRRPVSKRGAESAARHPVQRLRRFGARCSQAFLMSSRTRHA